MKAYIRNVVARNCTTKDKKTKFTMIDITCDVVTDEEKGTCKTRKASMNAEYAKKYFNYCGVSSKDLPGKEVAVTLETQLWKDTEGKERRTERIKWLNLIDDEGNAIIMPKDDDPGLDW